MARLEIRITNTLNGEAQEILEDQLAEFLRLKNLTGVVRSLTTGNSMEIQNPERAFEMRTNDLMGVTVQYPPDFWAERQRREAIDSSQ
jgi:hypothetical protein